MKAVLFLIIMISFVLHRASISSALLRYKNPSPELVSVPAPDSTVLVQKEYPYALFYFSAAAFPSLMLSPVIAKE
jgi:hypothetical protein